MYCGKNITDVVSVTTLSNFDISCCTEGNMVYVQDENAFYLVQCGQLVKRVDFPAGSGGSNLGITYTIGQEVWTGDYFDDGQGVKKIYYKVVDCGNMPGGARKTIAHGITGIQRILSLRGSCTNTSNGETCPLPYVSPSSAYLAIWADGQNIYIQSGHSANSASNQSQLLLKYTCTDR